MTTSNVTVYSKPNCPQCEMTKKELTRQGVEFKTVDMSKDEDARNKVVDMGIRAAPVVFAGEEVWSGFRPDLISNLVKSLVPAMA